MTKVKCRLNLKIEAHVRCVLKLTTNGVECVLKENEVSLIHCKLYIVPVRKLGKERKPASKPKEEAFVRKRPFYCFSLIVRPAKKIKKTMYNLLIKVHGVHKADINIKPSSTVGELKAMVISELGDTVRFGCVFFFQGKKLKDDTCKLEDYKITDGGSIWVGARQQKTNKLPKMSITVAPFKPMEKTEAPLGSGVVPYLDYLYAHEDELNKQVAEYLALIGEEEYKRRHLTEEEFDNLYLLPERLYNREGPPVLPDYIQRTKLARPCKCRPGLVRWFPVDEFVYYASFDELPETISQEWAEYVWEQGSDHIAVATKMYAENRRKWFSYGLFHFYCGDEKNLEDDEKFALWLKDMVMEVVGTAYNDQLFGDTLYHDFDVNSKHELNCSILHHCCTVYYYPFC